ncbi:hypothetical protein B0J13DRAFT_68665 [Dactylonectria estremocensis]|uniref:Uncharacterized protein n=1 Tax=Dactylonectria estremocensis TaxID=1079267 RepID=A0A9P9ELX7_9HYPO|nr:hypothetical protein B0J13DRAFT_68665 [Dactylonectria estremocensis]
MSFGTTVPLGIPVVGGKHAKVGFMNHTTAQQPRRSALDPNAGVIGSHNRETGILVALHSVLVQGHCHDGRIHARGARPASVAAWRMAPARFPVRIQSSGVSDDANMAWKHTLGWINGQLSPPLRSVTRTNRRGKAASPASLGSWKHGLMAEGFCGDVAEARLGNLVSCCVISSDGRCTCTVSCSQSPRLRPPHPKLFQTPQVCRGIPVALNSQPRNSQVSG